jgi:hypothetical protein
MPFVPTDLFPEFKRGNTPAKVRLRLASMAQQLAILKRELLEALRTRKRQLDHPMFLWRALLQSFATMGGASGWAGLVTNKENSEALSYRALAEINRHARQTHILKVCRKAKVRYASRKAAFILGCFDRIERMGGPSKAKQQLLAQSGRDAKIAFLCALPGIGEKYARNIMMSVCHPEFHECVAIDSRIKAIATAWGLALDGYDEHEEFFLSVAKAAGLTGWELDRLMFWCQTAFLPPIG